MVERYLYNQSGVVEELCKFTKAVLSFKVHNNSHRVLLWVKNFMHEGEMLDPTDSLHGKLRVGEPVTFHCHPYDKERNDDYCDWFAAKAWKSTEQEQLTVMNQQGCVITLETGKGILEFDFFGKEERVYFIRSKVYNFGHRVASKQPLSSVLLEDTMVQFDATRCPPTTENNKCSWFARIVWKGKKPAKYSSAHVMAAAGGVPQQLHNTVVAADGDNEEPTTDAPSLSNHLYKKFEGGGAERVGLGSVESLLSEQAAVALWMIVPNCWETVFFHRSICYIDKISLAKYNLQEVFPKETRLDIIAVPAVKSFPCKWIARRVMASS